jgi:hypothetical protein
MKPKEFIDGVLINEMKDIVNKHPYFSFLLISVGIEFLGKCLLTNHQNWNAIRANKAFTKGVEMLHKIDERYKELNLKDELRDGFAHTFLPKSKIALSEIRAGAKNFQIHGSGKTVLVAEEFYRDFVIACREVINAEFPENDKMNKEFLYIGA